MTTLLHKIEKQIFAIELSNGQSLPQVKNQLAELCYTTLPLVLEKICNQVSVADYTIQVDKISLDLGEIQLDSLTEDLTKKVSEQLETALIDAITLGQTLRATSSSKTPTSLATNDILTYFLSTGNLPVWLNATTFDLDKSLEAIMKHQPQIITKFLHNSTNKPDKIKRLAQVLNVSQFKNLVITLTQKQEFNDLLEDLIQLREGSSELKCISINALKEMLLNGIINSGSNLANALNLIADTLVTLLEKNSSFKTNFSELICDPMNANIAAVGIGQSQSQNKTNPNKLDNRTKKSNKETDEITSSDEKINALITRAAALKKQSALALNEAHTNKNAPKTKSKMQNNDLIKKCVVNNAGLILLWPSLSFLFAECGLTQDDEFISEAAQERAVLLLQFALGDENIAYQEFDLALNKLMCGLAIDTAIEMEFIPTESEKEAIEKLLLSIIKAWKALKNTSIYGLQDTYLKRTGYLIKRDTDWLLEIERQTWDLLLDQLPWGIGIVKLPWMENMIYTEW